MDHGKKEVTESETDEGVRNIRIKSDQRQTGHDQNSHFAGGNQKGRRWGRLQYEGIPAEWVHRQHKRRAIVIYDPTPSFSAEGIICIIIQELFPGDGVEVEAKLRTRAHGPFTFGISYRGTWYRYEV